MAKNKWDKHIKLLEAAKADPEKVFNLLSTVYGKKKFRQHLSIFKIILAYRCLLQHL